jgi:molecular chaperone DnaJ
MRDVRDGREEHFRVSRLSLFPPVSPFPPFPLALSDAIVPRMDYYAVLGIAPGATDEDIKKAYRRLVLKYHPDRNPNDKEAEAKIREINAAYEVVGDAETRRTYERLRFGDEPREAALDPEAILQAMEAKLFDEGRKEIFAILIKDLNRVRAELAVVRERTVAAQGYDSFKESIIESRAEEIMPELVTPDMEARKGRLEDVAFQMMTSQGVIRVGDERHANEVRDRLREAFHKGRNSGFSSALELLYQRR